MDDNIEGMITVSEAAERLGRSTEQVRRYLREGKLAGRRIGNQWFIDEQALETTYKTGEREPTGILREVAATFEAGRATGVQAGRRGLDGGDAEKMDKEEITKRVRTAEILMAIDANFAEIEKRTGVIDVNLIEMIREDRDSH